LSDDFSITRRVQFAETDLAGVLYFANYFRYMEEVEHAFWRSVGLPFVSPEGERKFFWPRVSVSCDYSAPARFEDELTLGFRVTHVGSKSVKYEIEFSRDGQRIATGRVAAVCCEVRDRRFGPMDIPATARSKLLAALQPAPLM